MPELPEVENVVTSIKPYLMGKKIIGADVFYPPVLKEEDEAIIMGERIGAITRRGKYILFHMSRGYLILHLRMTGQLFYRESKEERDKHTHVILHLDDGHYLAYRDVRKFGGFTFIEKDDLEGYFKNRLGVEPLSLGLDDFKKMVKGKKGPLKRTLLDQKWIAGIGNIYGDEILFDAGIHPLREGTDLNDEEMERLYQSMQKILLRAIERGGSSVKDYVDGEGKEGAYQKEHKVYGRKGAPCVVCGEPLVKIKVGGRTSVYCPCCQEGKE